MAQKREKEGTEFEVPETLLPCVNNCGHSGNPATQNMCQKCFQAAGFHTTPPPSAIAPAPEKPKPSSIRPFGTEKPADVTRIPPCEPANPPVRKVNRCSCCRRKVGLTGFRCRCGDLFCSDHRYSDRHACSYDYKSAGREAIARENPLVRAAKIVRI